LVRIQQQEAVCGRVVWQHVGGVLVGLGLGFACTVEAKSRAQAWRFEKDRGKYGEELVADRRVLLSAVWNRNGPQLRAATATAVTRVRHAVEALLHEE
jgi:hypothetical protein